VVTYRDYVHLASRSFFRDRRTDFVTRTHLRHTNHRGLQLVLTFLYTGEMTLTFRNITDILQCAKELDLGKVFDVCEQFLSTFDKRHVFRVLELSRRFGMKKAFFQSHSYLSTNFNQCITMKHFLQLPYTTIGHILADETIEHRDETIVFSRVLNWITSNHIDNNQVMMNLLQTIRWNKLDYQQQREWLTASQELAENPKLTSFIKEQLT
jgi:kelch-like protein 2/3